MTYLLSDLKIKWLNESDFWFQLKIIQEEQKRKEAEKLAADYRLRENEKPTAATVFGKIRPCPGIIVESRRSSFIRRKSLDNAKLLDAHVAM